MLKYEVHFGRRLCFSLGSASEAVSRERAAPVVPRPLIPSPRGEMDIKSCCSLSSGAQLSGVPSLPYFVTLEQVA